MICEYILGSIFSSLCSKWDYYDEKFHDIFLIFWKAYLWLLLNSLQFLLISATISSLGLSKKAHCILRTCDYPFDWICWLWVQFLYDRDSSEMILYLLLNRWHRNRLVQGTCYKVQWCIVSLYLSFFYRCLPVLMLIYIFWICCIIMKERRFLIFGWSAIIFLVFGAGPGQIYIQRRKWAQAKDIWWQVYS